jgi:hypothetical protein
MLLAPSRSLLVEIPAIAVTSHRKLRDLEQASRNGSTQDHHSVQIRIHASLALDSEYVS